MKIFKKAIAVILCISMAFSLCFTGANASENAAVTTVSCEEDLKNLEFDDEDIEPTDDDLEYEEEFGFDEGFEDAYERGEE